MKSLNFKRQENAKLRYLEEKVTGKSSSRINWDRIVYLSILGLIVFFVLRYFFLHSFYITADGQVLFETVEIGETQDIRIERFQRRPGWGQLAEGWARPAHRHRLRRRALRTRARRRHGRRRSGGLGRAAVRSANTAYWRRERTRGACPC